MNNKVTLQDLAEQLAATSGQSKKLSEGFLRALTEIVEEALAKDGIAKVKGLGTFKIIAIDERKSVSVTDGSTVIIPAHNKISFTPEKELKEALNKPYEHLETYVLPNDGPVDGPFNDEDDEEPDNSYEEVNNDTAVESNNTQATTIQAPSPEIVTTENQVITDESKQEAIKAEPKMQDSTEGQPLSAAFISTTEPQTTDGEQPTISNTTEERKETVIEPSLNGTTAEENKSSETAPEPTAGTVTDNEVVSEQSQANEGTDESKESENNTNPTPTQNEAPQDSPKENIEGTSANAPLSEQAKEEAAKEGSVPEKENAPTAETTNEANQEGQTGAGKSQEGEEGKDARQNVPQGPTDNSKKEDKEPKNKKNKSLLVVIIILILLIFACLFFALFRNDKGIGNLDAIKTTITDIFNKQEAPKPDTVITPKPEAKIEKEKEEYFEELNQEKYEMAQADQEFPEQVVEQNWDWFDEEFKKFIKKEYPKINFEVKGEPYTDTIKSGQTLTSMSRKYYNGSKDFWVYIYLYNKATIRRPDDVPAGTEIKIPQLDESVINPSSYESINAAKDVKESYLRLFN